jgi:hypothetical protein
VGNGRVGLGEVSITRLPLGRRIRRLVEAYKPFWIAGAVLVVIALPGVGALWMATTSVPHLSSRGQVSSIELAQWPEPPGPSAPPVVYSSGVSFESVVAALPVPLPRRRFDPFTRCHVGVDLTIRLTNGASVVYGPCRRPAAINRVLDVVESVN